MRLASLDIGSNTVRLLVAELRAGRWERIYLDHIITRLGGGFDGTLKSDAMIRTVDAVKKFQQIASNFNVASIRAVCTGVVRKADNISDFIERMKVDTGVHPLVVSGKQEANLSAKGAAVMTDLEHTRFLLFDIGGFSTEIVCVEKGHPVFLVSLDLGVIPLSEDWFTEDPPPLEELSKVRSMIDPLVLEQMKSIRKNQFQEEVLMGTAGTVTTLAALDLGLQTYNPELVNGHRISRSRLMKLYQELCAVPADERLNRFPALEKGREDLIIAGCLITIAVMDRFGHRETIATEGGLLEGILFEENWPLNQNLD